MKIKRTLVTILVLCLMVSNTFAEESGGNVLDDIGNWFGQAWKDTSNWVSQAWTDTTSWVNGAWGDASKWVGQAWNDSSTWATDIWGDVSTWANDASGAVNTWWTDTFNSVPTSEDQAWEWIDKEQQAFHTLLVQEYKDMIESAKNGSENAETSIEKVYQDLLKGLQLDEADITKVMDTIKAYANEKGLSVSSLEKILLPYLLQLTVDSAASGNGKIPPVAVAQYLTGIVEKIGIKNEDQAQQLITSLDEVLNAK